MDQQEVTTRPWSRRRRHRLEAEHGAISMATGGEAEVDHSTQIRPVSAFNRWQQLQQADHEEYEALQRGDLAAANIAADQWDRAVIPVPLEPFS